MADPTEPSAHQTSAAEAPLLIVAADEAYAAKARKLAVRLGAPLTVGEAWSTGKQLLLLVDDKGLRLRRVDSSEVAVDVAALARPRRGEDLLGRAIGMRAGHVVDATAGLGVDAFQLAAAGHRVTMIERVPLVALLLEEALERAQQGRAGDRASAAAERLTLIEGDARTYLATLPSSGRPDVVLLDPMYPRRGKAALPAKGMALFRELVGEDDDAAELLRVARSVALRRVVVKRPLRSASLGDTPPSGSIRGKTTRYDLYAPTTAPSKAK